jgi:pimeloyl-ACP methyl ester carboxylesterase
MVAALLDTLGIDAIDIVCNDSGGVIAQLFMTSFPQRVRTILFTTTEVDANNPPPSFRPVIQFARQGVLSQFFQAGLANPDQARSGGLGSAYTNPANLTNEAIDTYLKPLVASPERIAQFNAYTIALDENVLVPIAPQLRASQVPARLVWSENAPGFPVETAQWLDKALPKSRGLRVVPGAKLFFPEEMPDLVAAEAEKLWTS